MECSAPTKCTFSCTGGNCATVVCKADTCEQNCTGQGWIQTSATSFQKLVRIVKKFKKNLRNPCQKVSTARCQFPGV